eukprot:symbB.v1.2.039943.t1/scaffold6888.1/size21695/3
MAARPCTKAYGRHYPGRQMADDWLDFMLSQRNLWPTFTTKKAQITGQASLSGGQAELECVVRPDVHSGPLGSHESNYMRYYSTRLSGASHRNPYEEKAYRGPAHKEVQAWWEHNAKRGCCITNANVRHWPRTLKAFCMHSGKEEDTREDGQLYRIRFSNITWWIDMPKDFPIGEASNPEPE